MHYHLEIIMPPVDDVEKAIAQIMKPFDEQGEDEDGNTNDHAFWDWYQIGGRWSGVKLESFLGKERLDLFHQELSNRKVTVSGFQCGKQTLSPESQIPMVDALWREMFPDSGITVCPLFDHSPKILTSDICTILDLPPELSASRVIVAEPSWRDDGSLQAEYMISDSIWNGVMHVKTQWDGKVKSAIDEAKEKASRYREEFQAKRMPQDDWLVVTVNYHS